MHQVRHPRLHGLLPVLFVMAAPLAMPDVAGACTCVRRHCSDAAQYDAIFEATVERIDRPPASPAGIISTADPVTVRLGAIRGLKGVSADYVTTAGSSASCGFEFETGRRYLIFARRSPDNGQLTVSFCGLTRLLDGSRGMVGYVESLSAGPGAGRIFGRVLLEERMSGRGDGLVPLPSAQIQISGPRRETSTTDESGVFEFTGLPPGRYQLTSTMPRGRDDLRSQPLLVIPEGTHACEEITIVPAQSTEVRGVVLDENGFPMPGVFVMLEPNNHDPSRGGGLGVTTISDGTFAFFNIPPGQYVVDLNRSGPMPVAPFAPLRALTKDGLSVIEVPRAGRVELPPLRPRRVSPITLTGRVLTEDGAPAQGLEVRAIMLVDDGRLITSQLSWTDNDGNFTLRGYSGLRYKIHVGGRAPLAAADVLDASQPILITLPRK